MADRAGEYLGVTGHISSTESVLYLVNTRTDRLAVLFWSRTYKRLERYANVDLREVYATSADGR